MKYYAETPTGGRWWAMSESEAVAKAAELGTHRVGSVVDRDEVLRLEEIIAEGMRPPHEPSDTVRRIIRAIATHYPGVATDSVERRVEESHPDSIVSRCRLHRYNAMRDALASVLAALASEMPMTTEERSQHWEERYPASLHTSYWDGD